jgi:tripartite-type tricarboxylate transporter receptor subunit TctC
MSTSPTCSFIASVSLLSVFNATAQTYSTKPVRVIVGFPPGAGVDTATRLVTAKLTESLGTPFIVDNRAGAAGNIAVELAGRAAPDGYTLGSVTAAATISQSAYTKRNERDSDRRTLERTRLSRSGIMAFAVRCFKQPSFLRRAHGT